MNTNQLDSTQRIKAIGPGMAKGKAKELLDAVEKKYGGVPNSFKTMANAPAVLQGFLGLSGTLEGGVLPFETRYQIAIAVSEINGCPYCLSAFTAIGKGAGMKDETLAMCRMAGSTDPKIDATLKFAAANFSVASIFGSVDPAIRHIASVSSFMPAPLPIAVKPERQYGQPLISETTIAIWYRVSNGNTPPSSVPERPRKP